MSRKKIISVILLLVVSPIIVLGGVLLFDGREFAWVCLAIAIISCVACFLSFEHRESLTKRLVIIAVMTALCIAGRLIFAPLPGFKPITAMAIITALYFGSEAGFLAGSLTALISNFYFGQGAWTPFQMLVWGLIGFIAGLAFLKLKDKFVLLLIFGAVAGVVFSLLMDFWTVLWTDGGVNLTRYVALVITALPVTIEYAVSNVIFLALLNKPLGKKLERLCTKYGI